MSKLEIDEWAKQFGVPDSYAIRDGLVANCAECEHRIAHLVAGGEYDDDHWRYSCSIGASNELGKCEHFRRSLIGPETPAVMIMATTMLATVGMIVAAIFSR